MPRQIHWTVGSVDLRSHVRCPKMYRSQQTGHSHTVGHCQSKGLQGCHALKTSLSAVRRPCWHCSDQVEGIGQGSSSSRSHLLPGGQLLLVWRYLWHTSAMGEMVLVWVWGVLQHSGSGSRCRFHTGRQLLRWPFWCWARRNFHMRTTVTLLFPGGIDAVEAGFSPFWQEEWQGLHLAGLGCPWQWGFLSVASMGRGDEGPPWCPQASLWWWGQLELTFLGHSQRLVGRLLCSLVWCGHDGWWYPMEGLALAWDWSKRVFLVWPFLYLGSNRLWNHIPVGVASYIVAVQVCLLGSSWRWIQAACGSYLIVNDCP